MILSEAQKQKLLDFANKGLDSEAGTQFVSMTYEQGIKDVLEVLDGDVDIDELVTG